MPKITILTILTLVGLPAGPLQAGDIAAGANVYNARGCVGCHGVSGKKPIANYPVVGGKPANFIAGELAKFRSGERTDPVMAKMASALSDADIDDLSSYLEAQ